ncbi:hypothetical protein [Paraburkholderia terricola]|uniref:Cytoskeletal protein RodZ n=1 Tax=Paraburkholderia terricola TaxID=169427 RepID=A0ABU1M1P8_9BURK|nr:hypothetical protein [Paraburkholderia terricola]MDR6412926.1 cytoskeletal protein RodZ [Paraburkholderia terricola]MDR6485290.1 cytoskeletal protein RodZ [Paraburkholderia terricola]
MQIDSALSSTLPEPGRAAMKNSRAADDAAVQTRAAAETSTQDEAVHISAEGAATAAQEGKAVNDDATGDSAAEDAAAPNVSAVQSFAYGTLGLERPDEPHEEHNAFYTAGRWLAAGITIGGIISLLV